MRKGPGGSGYINADAVSSFGIDTHEIMKKLDELEHSVRLGESMRGDMYQEQKRLSKRVEELEKFIDGLRTMSSFFRRHE